MYREQVTLIGFPNSGKTALGLRLAERRNCHFWDSDRILEELYLESSGEPLSCRAICQRHGEDYFRRLEAEALSLLPEGAYVLALGGGSPLYSPLHRQHHCIYLYVSVDEIYSRGFSPFTLDSSAYRMRHRRYLDCADQVLDLSGLNFEAALDRLSKRC